MKDAWFLATNCKDKKTREIVNLYARRWKIEPYFRDIKDQRFGFGLAATHIKSAERRDRLLLVVAMAYVLFTLLGAAGEQLGFDRKLKVNTVKTRTHSLIRQGMFCRVGGGAYQKACHRPPLKLDVQFSRIQLSQSCAFRADSRKVLIESS